MFLARGAIVSALLSLPTACAEPADGGPAPGIVLLQNGNLLRGVVQRLDDHYRVEMAGGELLVRIEQVEMICQSVDEVYEKRRASRAASSADTHLELARWCMRLDMYEHAERELEDARAIDPGHRRLPLLERQLDQLVKLTARKLALPGGPTSATVSHPVSPGEARGEAPVADTKDLDKAPKWARALFVRQVQPLLVHSCATAGCHQPGAAGGQFPLDRLALDGAGHPDVTLRNLSATLSHINWEYPEQSRLLVQAISAHGGAQEKRLAPLPPHKLAVLRMWVEQMVLAGQRVNGSEQMAAELTAADSLEAGLATTEPAAAQVQLARYEQQDPFDPGFFNQRYAAAPGAAPESKAATHRGPPFLAVPGLAIPSAPLTPPPAPTPPRLE